MLATDPLSLLFLGCALFSGLFLVATVLLGAGHSHAGHLGGHGVAHGAVHAPTHTTVGHAPTHAAIGHAPTHTTVGHAPTHAAASASHQVSGQVAPTPTAESLWGVAQSLVLGSLNINGALIFLLVFGLLGYMLHAGQATATLLILLVAALVGVVAAIAVNAALTRLFITSQAGELSVESSRLEGRLASVSIAIRAQGLGEVVFNGEAGARQSIGARSSDGLAIAAGTEVVILEATEGLATVQPWDRFLSETRDRLTTDPPELRLPAAAPPGSERPAGE